MLNAHLDDVRIIGDATRDGHPGYNSRKYMVRADGPIRTIEDLKGKVLATNSIAGAMDTAMRVIMRRHGLEDKRDFQIVEIDFPNMFAVLTSGKIDLASISLPFSIAAEQSGKVRTLFTMRDAIGESDMTIMAARAPFIAAHRAALVDFFEDSQRAMRWFYDPANRAQVVALIARFTKEPSAAYAGWLFTRKDDYRDPALKPSLAAVQADIDRQVEARLPQGPGRCRQICRPLAGRRGRQAPAAERYCAGAAAASSNTPESARVREFLLEARIDFARERPDAVHRVVVLEEARPGP